MLKKGDYRIYGKIGNMKQFRPISKNEFVKNLIFADIFTIYDEKSSNDIEKELKFINKQGTFELRKIK